MQNVPFTGQFPARFTAGSDGEFDLHTDLATVIVVHADPRFVEPVDARLSPGSNFATRTEPRSNWRHQSYESVPLVGRFALAPRDPSQRVSLTLVADSS